MTAEGVRLGWKLSVRIDLTTAPGYCWHQPATLAMLHWGSIIKSTLQQCYIRAKIDIISLHIFTDFCILPCYEIQEVWCKMCEPRDQQHWKGRSKNVSFQNNRQDGTKMWEKGKILC